MEAGSWGTQENRICTMLTLVHGRKNRRAGCWSFYGRRLVDYEASGNEMGIDFIGVRWQYIMQGHFYKSKRLNVGVVGNVAPMVVFVLFTSTKWCQSLLELKH